MGLQIHYEGEVYVEVDVTDTDVCNNLSVEVSGDTVYWNGTLDGEVDVDIREDIELDQLSGFTKEIVEEICNDYGIDMSSSLEDFCDDALVTEMAVRYSQRTGILDALLRKIVTQETSRAIAQYKRLEQADASTT